MSGIGIATIVVGSVLGFVELCYLWWWLVEDPVWSPVFFVAIGEKIDRHVKWKAGLAAKKKRVGIVRIVREGGAFYVELYQHDSGSDYSWHRLHGNAPDYYWALQYFNASPEAKFDTAEAAQTAANTLAPTLREVVGEFKL